MAVTVGGVTLDERLLLRGLFESSQIQTYQQRLLSGGLHISSRPQGSRTLVLTTDGPNNVKHGLFTREQLISLAAVRDAGVQVTLTHGSDSFSVYLPSEGISVEPLIERSTKNAGDRYTGSISFIEV